VLGTTLDGKYRIDRLLGAGAMGSVYEAQHTGTGRRVAVKLITSVDVARDAKLIARFQREAKAAGAIDTQHITQVLDTGVDEAGAPYLVMELLDGEDLQHVFARVAPLPPDLALRIAAQACLGLQKAHEAGVVHRDIKPANLFLAKRDAGEIIVKVLDFGLAKVKTEAGAEPGMALTKTGSMLGSPLYMAPEQARGLKTIDHRADLWSLGVVLYRALTGRTPYDACDALGGLIIAICHEDAEPVQQKAPWVAPEIAEIVHKALQRDAAARFESAAAMLAAIRALLPNGWAIQEDMVRTASDAEKAVVAPRLGGAPAPSAQDDLGALGSRVSGRPPPMAANLAPPPSPPVVVKPPPAAPPAEAALVKAVPVAPPRNARLPLLVGATLILATGVGGYLAARPQAPVPRLVKLVVLPGDASVELDGARAALQDGVLDIRGAAGSAHRVRVFKGDREIVAEVKVTDSGASPPKVELPAGKP
jgi:serine/threonine-protein kinase